MNNQEKAPAATTANKGLSKNDFQKDVITETLREILHELDVDLYRCTVCISAIAAGKKLRHEDAKAMFNIARRFHGLARLQRND